MIARFDPGEELITGLARLADEKNIGAAALSGIGSAAEVELGYYDVAAKEYRKKVFPEKMELVGLSGNISVLNGEKSVHLHGAFSREDYGMVGGHVHRLVVSATVEVVFEIFPATITRRKSEETGLNLMD
jgi:predicted DNA-binding protein with PD1-like motif